jgi:hypothetical protein
MGLEMFLFLAGSGLGIAVLGVVVYRAIPVKAVHRKIETEKNLQSPPKPAEIEIVPETEPVSEAPPPFSEDSTSHISKGIAAPTDTTAIGTAAPFVSIQLPKTMKPAPRAKRKRRGVKAKTFPADLTGGLPSMDPPDKKEPSAA